MSRAGAAPDTVRDALRRAIRAGTFTPGQPLRQDQLAARFGTSRIPVREALRQLEAEGYVTLHPNRGAIVASLSPGEVLELLDIREALECHALRLAVPRMGEPDLTAAEAILDAYDAAPEPDAWGEMNWRFHRTLYAPSDRPRLIAMIEINYGHVSRFTRAMVSRAAGKEGPQRDHRQLVAWCRAGNAGAAAALLARHLEQTRKSLMALLRQRSDRAAG